MDETIGLVLEGRMAFTQRAFCGLRPRLYHLTARANLPFILEDRGLRSAADMYLAAGQPQRIRQRRRVSEDLRIDGRSVNIRDQAPLHPGNMQLDDGMQFDDFVAHLNQHVFFWPGKAVKPIPSGLRHFNRYREEDCVVLSIDSEALFEANAPIEPRFCRYNSGSPRCTGGLGSPRGLRTFVRSTDFAGSAASVVEVVFPERVVLPAGAFAVQDLREYV